MRRTGATKNEKILFKDRRFSMLDGEVDGIGSMEGGFMCKWCFYFDGIEIPHELKKIKKAKQ